MPKQNALWIRVLVALALLFCGACASMAARVGDVADVEWKLAAWTLSSLPAGNTGITATFADGEISGFSGVNSFGAACRMTPDGSFRIGAMRMTKRAGPEPAMRAEGAFSTLLAQARSWQLRGDRLTLFDASGNESLSFTRRPASRATR